MYIIPIRLGKKTRIDEKGLFRFSIGKSESSGKFFAVNEKFAEVIVRFGVFDDVGDAI